jgi:hypothetical protein
VLLAAIAGSSATPAAIVEPATPEVPAVTFSHSGLLEGYCANWSPAKPDPAAIAEVTRRLPEFQAAWDREGPALMRETVRVTGEPYRFKETIAVLHACPDMASLSYPLVIAVARYTDAAGGAAESGLVLRAARAGKLPLQKLPPKPIDDFADTVFHELQHRYITELIRRYPGGETPLMVKYAKESANTRHHLHLFAIERLVRRNLGSLATYEAGRKRVRDNGYQGYIRAYEIVDAEGPDRLVAELRAR